MIPPGQIADRTARVLALHVGESTIIDKPVTWATIEHRLPNSQWVSARVKAGVYVERLADWVDDRVVC